MPSNSDDEYYHLRPPLSEECWSRIADAVRLIVYSLSPESWGNPEDSESLHGYPIIKQIDIVDLQTIAEIYSNLRAGADEGTRGERCFNPHHGVRAIHGQGTVDLVICFSCTNMEVFDSSANKPFSADISEKPNNLLNALLEAKSDTRNGGE